MFFLIAGIQPRTKILDKNPRLCPACGLTRAYLKRVDHYVSLFFIPLFPVKRGDPVVSCEHCEKMAFARQTPYETKARQGDLQCRACGKILEGDFLYCPYCGRPV